ncbi:hypothetical protein AB0J82_17585 [Asanoa sp. NPDC049518]|uniref:hypothetical protein n=1 Tax=unclassified Asanoa TaxID=2685164 RepID=UPI003427C8DC
MSEPVEVDFDLLADYVGGALDGTPEHDRVASLVATDVAWSQEHDLLLAALEATADDLATFAEQTAEPMPDAVLTRLLAALPTADATPVTQQVVDTALPPTEKAAGAQPATALPPTDQIENAARAALPPAEMTVARAEGPALPSAEQAVTRTERAALPPTEQVAGGERAALPPTETVLGGEPTEQVAGAETAGPGSRSRAVRDGVRAPRGRRAAAGPAGRPAGARRRPRWLSWAAPALVAVAVAAFAGVWINQSVGTGTSGETAAGAADSAAQAPNSAAGAALAVPRFATGRDYNGAAVAGGFGGTSARASVKAQSPGVMSAEEDQPEGAVAKSVEPELLRLNAEAALAVCVDAIAQAHGQGPITVSAADFSSYQGRPAVIVFFTDSAGLRWGWAVGPDCGPGGTDELFRSRVG